MTQVATFMAGLRDGAAKTQLYREYPDTLEDAFKIAMREDFNARQAKNSRGKADFGGPEPMDLSLVTQRNDPRPLNDWQDRPSRRWDRRDQQRNILCHRCGRDGHIARECRAPAPVSGASRRGHDEERRRGDNKAKNVRFQ